MSFVDKISDLAYRYSRKHETGTDYNGALSYAGEFHALALGLAVGFASIASGAPQVAAGVVLATLGLRGSARFSRALSKIGKKKENSTALGEMRREPWYAVGGVIIGMAFGAGVLVLVGQPVPEVVGPVVELLEVVV
jgi:hypothetical protein